MVGSKGFAMVGEVYIALFVSGVVVCSALYWMDYLIPAHFSLGPSTMFVLIGRFGFLMSIVLPLVLGDIFLPYQLCVSDAGIMLRRCGFTKVMCWENVQKIKLQLIIVGSRVAFRKTLCKVIGRNETLNVEPVFGVNPASLARYLQMRGQSKTGHRIELTPTQGSAEEAIDCHIQPKTNGASFAMSARIGSVMIILSLFSLLLLLLGASVGNQTAITIIRILNHCWFVKMLGASRG